MAGDTLGLADVDASSNYTMSRCMSLGEGALFWISMSS